MSFSLVRLYLSDICCKITLNAVTIAVVIQIVVDASLGDRTWKFEECLEECRITECEDEDRYIKSQPTHMQLLQWSCLDECKYLCMWQTVEAFQKENVTIPQFYGKWPFVRLWGMQEPASVIFSALNGLAHLGIFYFRSKVPKNTPMYYIWHGYAIVFANTWFWSLVFHARDKDFTEMMDNFCAFSTVVYNVFAFGCRVLGTEKHWRVRILGLCLAVFFFTHIAYLAFVKFDYGYNMQINIGTAIVNSAAWLMWSYRHRRKQPYVKKCVFVVIGLNVLLLLGVFDIPPYRWVFDAHSLWHAGTVPLAFVWYSFIIDDCLYLHSQQQEGDFKLD